MLRFKKPKRYASYLILFNTENQVFYMFTFIFKFMTEELQYKNGMQEREKKFHGSDSLISVDEMWKSWHHSEVYNWTTDDVITWLNDQVKLPIYGDYFRRNKIDGQFMPRLAINENNYYINVMQIRDARHKRILMIKSTDLVLFGPQPSIIFSM